VNTWLLRCLVGGLVLSTPALAQDDDAPYAYPDDEPSQEEEEVKPRRSRYADPGEEFKEVAEQEDDDEKSFKRLYRMDDPNLGLAGEVIAGALLLDSSRGAFAETLLGVGLRFTWEYGRLLDSEALRDALWADVRWTYGALSDGTTYLTSQTNVHYFTLAPAYELRLFNGLGLYGQVGGGAAYHATSLMVGTKETVVNGLKPVIQYGVGLRGRPRLSDSLSLAFRVEVTRFRRGYMDDTFIGGSIGTAF
jgi:hypothetical protein